jgi:hypothetical protein
MYGIWIHTKKKSSAPTDVSNALKGNFIRNVNIAGDPAFREHKLWVTAITQQIFDPGLRLYLCLQLTIIYVKPIVYISLFK